MNNISIIKGWDHEMSEFIDAHNQGHLIKLVTHLSNVCNLSCPGCFVNRPGDDVNEKRKARGPHEMSFDNQIELLKEAKKMGVQTVDIVGAGEPTLDPHFEQFIDEAEKLGMYVVVFTHCATAFFQKENLQRYKDRNISFFVKLWSLDEKKMNQYVRGSVQNYTRMRDEAVKNLRDLGFMKGVDIELDGIQKRTTRVGADILVMKNNIEEIPDIFRFCRRNNIMPEIKTFIPQGPTKLDHESGIFDSLSDKEQEELKSNKIFLNEFSQLRKELERIDKEEFGNDRFAVVYPQGGFCTQSAGSIYVTINGNILSCVGTGHIYEKYVPHKNILSQVVQNRTEQVSLGCIPRVEESEILQKKIPVDERKILELKKEDCK